MIYRKPGHANFFCRYCGSNLTKPNAKYCKECNHWQFSYAFVLPHLSLGDFILYVSVVAVLLSTFGTALFGRSAELEAILLSCGDYAAHHQVVNDGEFPGIITHATVAAKVESKFGKRVSMSLTVDERNVKSIPIAADDNRSMSFYVRSRDRKKFHDDGVDINSSQCATDIVITGIVDASAEKKKLKVHGECTCAEFVA